MKEEEIEKKEKAQAQVQAQVQVQVHHLILHQNQKMIERKDVKIKEVIVKITEGMIEDRAAKERIKDQDQETEKEQNKEKNQDTDHLDMMIEIKTERKRRETNAAEAEIINVLADDYDCITLN